MGRNWSAASAFLLVRVPFLWHTCTRRTRDLLKSMNWSLLGRALRLGFFLRIPLLTLVILAALGPVSQFSSAKSLLGNLFDQTNDAGATWWNIFAVSFSAFLLAFTAVTAINLVLHYGNDRFNDGSDRPANDEEPAKRFEISQKRPGLTFTLGTLAACVLVGTAIARTEGGNTWLSLSAALLAFICAMAITFAAKIVQLVFSDPQITPHPPPFLVFPVYRWGWLEDKLDRLYCWPPPDSKSRSAILIRRLKYRFGAFSQWLFQIFQNAGRGYLIVIDSPEGERFKLRSGHVFALTLSLLAFLTYVVVGVGKANITAAPANVPALAYVLLFFIVACWFLSALTFFFDRFRFPVVLSVMVLASLSASVPQSDHVFRVETPATVTKLRTLDVTQYLTPSQYLAERASDQKHRRLIFVATPGGGIQAAAWTAKVLKELDYMFKDDPGGADGFRKSVALISSVSGGSLGAMIYAASFAGNVDPGCTAENAKDSAIDEVAWGWTGPDVWRTVIPWFLPHLQIDRGWALEQKWALINGLTPEPNCMLCAVRQKNACIGKNPETSPVPAERETYLSDWAAKRAQIPALIFNSMLVELGQHVVFSTTRFPSPRDPRGIVNFYDLYANTGKPFDVRVNTAARLSASFPYVAVAARPNLNSPYVGDFHYVDGGYYDNLGIDSLIGWLSSAYDGKPDLNADLPEILVLQIRHFNPAALALPPRQGWAFQLFAPIVGLLNMWNNAPTHRDENELNLFIQDRSLSGRGPAIKTVTIPYCGLDYSKSADTEAEFEACITASGGQFQNLSPTSPLRRRNPNSAKAKRFNCADQPLSWKLSESQKECIDDTWKDFARDDPNGSLHSIKQFLTGPPQ